MYIYIYIYTYIYIYIYIYIYLFDGEPIEVTPLGRLNPKCETNITTDLKLMNCDDEHWIELAKVHVNLLNIEIFMTFMII